MAEHLCTARLGLQWEDDVTSPVVAEHFRTARLGLQWEEDGSDALSTPTPPEGKSRHTLLAVSTRARGAAIPLPRASVRDGAAASSLPHWFLERDEDPLHMLLGTRNGYRI